MSGKNDNVADARNNVFVDIDRDGDVRELLRDDLLSKLCAEIPGTAADIPAPDVLGTVAIIWKRIRAHDERTVERLLFRHHANFQ